MALSCIVCDIQWVTGQKSHYFIPHPVFRASAGGDPVGILRICLILIKLEWLGYHVVKKLWRYVKPFQHNTGVWWTDGWMDGETEFLYQYCASALLFWLLTWQNYFNHMSRKIQSGWELFINSVNMVCCSGMMPVTVYLLTDLKSYKCSNHVPHPRLEEMIIDIEQSW